MHSMVWPMQTHLILPPDEETIVAMKNSTYQQSALKALFRRCHSSAEELELNLCAETFPHLPPLLEVLSEFDFPSLQHVRLATTSGSIDTVELEGIASHRCAEQLLTISLDGNFHAHESSMDGHGSAGADLGSCFTRFKRLEALDVTTPSTVHPTISGLPATLKYLSIRFSETGRHEAAVDTWLRVATRDCTRLEVLRVMPRGSVEGVAWYFGGDCHEDEDWQRYTETAPSPDVIRLLCGLERLKVLQIAIGDGREDGASTHAIREVLAKLGRQLRAVAISSPTIGILDAIGEHCALSLEHLSFANSRHFLAKVVFESVLSGAIFHERPAFPALRSLEIKRLPNLVAKSFLIKIHYNNLERLYFGSSMFADYGVNFLFMERTLPKLSLLAATLDAPDLIRISEILSERESVAKAQADNAEARVDSNQHQLAFYPCFTESEPYRRDLPNVRVLYTLPLKMDLDDVLFGSLTNKPNFFMKQLDWWQE